MSKNKGLNVWTSIKAEKIEDAFDSLSSTLSSKGGTLADSCIRTWIYLKDIKGYKDMVDGRRKAFVKHGLKDHYIASTGVERADLDSPIKMDAYSIIGISPKDIYYLNAFDKLCSPKDYNVTFERGVRISYSDRYEYFISGTASIGKNGKSLYVGNTSKQLDRTMENICSLLASGGASLSDMRNMLVYLRDKKDFERAKSKLQKYDIPTVFVQANLCRPELLVEIEGIAMRERV